MRRAWLALVAASAVLSVGIGTFGTTIVGASAPKVGTVSSELGAMPIRTS